MEKATAIYPNDKKLAYVSILPSFLVILFLSFVPLLIVIRNSFLKIETEKKKKISQSTMETLAIIAYHQPTTRAEIEKIRGKILKYYLSNKIYYNY